MPSDSGIMNNSTKDLISAISVATDKLVRTIIISIGKLISVVVLSSFLIIISIMNKYAACIIISGYVIVYIYSKVVDFINRIPTKQFEENNPTESAQSLNDRNTSTA